MDVKAEFVYSTIGTAHEVDFDGSVSTTGLVLEVRTARNFDVPHILYLEKANRKSLFDASRVGLATCEKCVVVFADDNREVTKSILHQLRGMTDEAPHFDVDMQSFLNHRLNDQQKFRLQKVLFLEGGRSVGHSCVCW